MEHEIQARYANHILTACQWLENTEKKICLFSQVSMVCDIGLILTAAGMMSYPELLGTVDNHVHIPTENHPMLFFFFFHTNKSNYVSSCVLFMARHYMDHSLPHSSAKCCFSFNILCPLFHMPESWQPKHVFILSHRVSIYAAQSSLWTAHHC